MRLLLPPLMLVMMLSMFVGCVEVRDDKEAPKPVATGAPASSETSEQKINPDPEPEKDYLPDLIVDQPLYLYKGEVLSEAKYKADVIDQGLHRISADLQENFEYKYDEIRISRGGVLYTGGSTVLLKAQIITSDQGEIATFPEGQKAGALEEGRAGGSLVIRAQKASGFLKLTLRGEIGGDGVQGSAPVLINCHQDPQILQSGHAGKQGARGIGGKNGGNSGTLDMEVIENADFVAPVEREAGSGGIGGPGGGGELALTWEYCQSGFGELAQYLSRGEQGLPGPEGVPGKEEFYCSKIGNDKTCR